MNTRIRYGHEADIFLAISSEPNIEELEALRNVGRTVLSFSSKVRGLPDEEEFHFLLRELDVHHKDDELEEGTELYQVGSTILPTIPLEDGTALIPAIRMIEVLNPEEIDLQKLKMLGDGILGLVRERYDIGYNWGLFIDHTSLSDGITISRYNPLTGEIS